MKKLCFCLVGTLAVVALVAGGIAWANCSDPSGDFELVEAPCLGVEEGDDDYWHNEFTVKKMSNGSQTVHLLSNCATSNPGWFTVSINGGADQDLTDPGDPAAGTLTGGGTPDTFHFKYVPSSMSADRTAAVNFKPVKAGGGYHATRVLGWMVKP